MNGLIRTESPADVLAINSYSPEALNRAAKAQKNTPPGKIEKTGTEFETMVLSQLLKPMFEGLTSDGMFGGGEGEEAFKSLYIDAMAKQITKSGGVGISATVQKELIRMQASQTSGQTTGQAS